MSLVLAVAMSIGCNSRSTTVTNATGATNEAGNGAPTAMGTVSGESLGGANSGGSVEASLGAADSSVERAHSGAAISKASQNAPGKPPVTTGAPAIVRSSQGSPQPSLGTQTLPLSPAERVNRMREHYATLKSYNDDGRLIETRGQSVSTSKTQTRFNRESGAFALTYETTDRTYTISRSGAGDTVVHDSAAKAPDPRESLESTLRVARRMTKGATEILPALLLPAELEQSGFWDAISDFEGRGHEAIHGSSCSIIRGRYHGEDGHVDLWIDPDYSLRQILVSENRLGRTVRWTLEPTVK